MEYTLADSVLAPLGQTAALILALYLFISIVLGLVLVIALLFAFAWIREKAEMLRELRPRVIQLNQALLADRMGEPLPGEVADNRIIAAVAQAPRMAENAAVRADSIERSVERGSERVATAIIELHARTAMLRGMARAFFLPGLVRSERAALAPQTVEPPQVVEPEPVEPEASAEAEKPLTEPPLEQEIIIRQSSR